MNKQELSALVEELLRGMVDPPKVKASDYKATKEEPRPQPEHYHDGDFAPDVTKLDLDRKSVV